MIIFISGKYGSETEVSCQCLLTNQCLNVLSFHAIRSAESMPHKHAYGICLVAGFWFCYDFYRGVFHV